MHVCVWGGLISRFISDPHVFVCVTEVGCSWGGTRLVMCDLLQFTEPQTLRRTLGMGWNLPEQLAGSSSRSGHNQGAAVEADTIGEQQPKQTQSGNTC